MSECKLVSVSIVFHFLHSYFIVSALLIDLMKFGTFICKVDLIFFSGVLRSKKRFKTIFMPI